ncbi:MAG: DUF2339 domain-containing protein [Pirellulales bacterium]
MSASTDGGNWADGSGPQIADLRAALDRLADRVGQLERQFGDARPSALADDEELPILLTPIVAPSVGRPAGMPGERAATDSSSHAGASSHRPPTGDSPRDRPPIAALGTWKEDSRPWSIPDAMFKARSFDLVALEQLVGGRWLTWLGGLLLILAVAFFVPWAWQNFNMPAWLRVLIFHLCGAGIVGFGVWLRRRSELTTAAHGVIGVGLFTLYAAAFTLRHHYNLGGALSPQYTFIDCCAITLLGIGLAVRFRNPGIVLLGALGGYLTPIIADSGRTDIPLLLGYLAFLNIALLASASVRQWTFMKPLVFVATALMFLMAMAAVSDARAIRWQFELFAALHGLILLVATSLPAVIWRKPAEMLDLRTMAATSMAFMGITWYLFNDSPQRQLGLVAIGLAALHFFLGRTVARQQIHQDRLYRMHLVMSIAFLTLSVPLQLHQYAGIWAVTWGVEALVFTAMGVWFRDRQVVIAGLSIFSIALVRLFAFDYALIDRLGRQADLWRLDRRLALSAVIGTMMLLAGGSFSWVGREKQPAARTLFSIPVAEGLLVVGHLVILCGLIAQWPNTTGCMIVIFNALAIYLLGFRLGRNEVRYYAAALLLVIALPWMVSLTADRVDLGPQPWGTRFVLLALWSAVALGVGLLYRRRRLQSGKAIEASIDHPDGQELILENVLGIFGHFVLLGAFTLELRDYMESSRVASYGRMVELASYSVLWGVYASLAVVLGIVLKYRCYRLFGLSVLMLVLAKVFFVDLAALELMPRILALAVLGLLMMGVSLLYQRFMARVE